MSTELPENERPIPGMAIPPMPEPPAPPSPPPSPIPPEPWQERRAKRHREGHSGEHGGWGSSTTVGVVMLLLGGFFLAQTLGWLDQVDIPISWNNWWALFLLIPIIGNLTGFFQGMQKHNGRITGSMRSQLVWSLILTVVMGVFIFGLSWNIVWPFILIAIGIGALLSAATNR